MKDAVELYCFAMYCLVGVLVCAVLGATGNFIVLLFAFPLFVVSTVKWIERRLGW